MELENGSVGLGQRLQYYRELGKVTQQEMADACGLSKNYISALERGVNKCNVQTIIGYCTKLNRTPNELLNIGQTEIISELASLLSSMDKKTQKKIYNAIKALME